LAVTLGFRRDVVPAAAGVAAAGLLALVAYAVVDTLPRPAKGVDAASAALEALGRVRLDGAVVHLGGKTFEVSCRSRGSIDILTLPDGRRIVVKGTRLLVKPTTVPFAQAVPIADLGGSRRLIAGELAAAARRTEILVLGGDSGRTLALRLGRALPHVDVVVSRSTGVPRRLRFSSSSTRGSSDLLVAPLAGTPERRGC
jgi:hypothetical protein